MFRYSSHNRLDVRHVPGELPKIYLKSKKWSEKMKVNKAFMSATLRGGPYFSWVGEGFNSLFCNVQHAPHPFVLNGDTWCSYQRQFSLRIVCHGSSILDEPVCLGKEEIAAIETCLVEGMGDVEKKVEEIPAMSRFGHLNLSSPSPDTKRGDKANYWCLVANDYGIATIDANGRAHTRISMTMVCMNLIELR
ncbi:hypothetical protein SUGI_0433850 [Cryptomeria japonica]|nr:hypothetical protein SUGI_0433850 [Cryptomeria japonica]